MQRFVPLTGTNQSRAGLVKCEQRLHAMQFPIVLVAIAISLAGCSQETEYSDQQRACIAQRYKEFDARNLRQCVDICKACMRGNDITCNTSCNLKGAT
jgi:hypothetical protein